ncbi:MAG: undecaprenyl/decaprenyl-phosphate alpha-N-acetylglucosaminyl 1-phosphate transferase [Bacteroidetes bacterium]|nr:undecaprenyl/decaprenyl-phosphate alpha-N-acetylglucosaminyl 1-phosphate transferase [Bacteroidota bacterium]
MTQNILEQVISIDVKHIFAFMCSFAITWYAIPNIVHISRSKNLFDLPNGRTSHKRPTPTLGGAALFASLVITSMIFININIITSFQYVIAGSVIIFFTGLNDDLVDITWKKKVGGEFLAALFLIVLGDYRFTNLYGFFGIHEINYYWSILLTLFVMIGIVNSMNLIDGIDGLASGLSVMATSCFGFWFYMDSQYEMVVVCAVLAGSLMAFIGFNVFGHHNKIFMGDTGSLLLGYLMTFFVIVFTESNVLKNSPWHVNNAPIISFAILFIPLFDTLRVMGSRMIKGKSPFTPDRTHIHHKLLQLGFTHIQTTIILILINGLFIMLIFMLQDLEIHLLASILIVAGLCKSLIPIYFTSYYERKSPKVVFKLEDKTHAITEEAKKNGIKLKN